METSKLSSIFQIMPGLVNDADQPIRDLLEKFDEGSLNISKGLSFLDVKNHLLLDYLINLCEVILSKCVGQSICGSSSVDRLVEIRTYLERIHPIEQRLKYQIDKLVKTANTGYINTDDPLLLRANPANFVKSSSASTQINGDQMNNVIEDDDATDDDNRHSGSTTNEVGQKYRPPKLAAVFYDEGGKTEDMKVFEKAKKRLRSSTLMQEIREQYYDEPEEIVTTTNSDGHAWTSSYKAKSDNEKKERTRYEEETMTRLTVNKKQRQSERKTLSSTSAFSSLTKFGTDLSALGAENLDDIVESTALRKKNNSKRNPKKKLKKIKKIKKKMGKRKAQK